MMKKTQNKKRNLKEKLRKNRSKKLFRPNKKNKSVRQNRKTKKYIRGGSIYKQEVFNNVFNGNPIEELNKLFDTEKNNILKNYNKIPIINDSEVKFNNGTETFTGQFKGEFGYSGHSFYGQYTVYDKHPDTKIPHGTCICVKKPVGSDYFELYYGSWSYGEKNGKGKLITFFIGKGNEIYRIEYNGDWVNDKKEGFGRETSNIHIYMDEDGKVYTTDFNGKWMNGYAIQKIYEPDNENEKFGNNKPVGNDMNQKKIEIKSNTITPANNNTQENDVFGIEGTDFSYEEAFPEKTTVNNQIYYTKNPLLLK